MFVFRSPLRATLFPYTTLFRSAPMGNPSCSAIQRKCCSTGTAFPLEDRKSTRLNSSHLGISYAVFCLKKKRTAAVYGQFRKAGVPAEIHVFTHDVQCFGLRGRS